MAPRQMLWRMPCTVQWPRRLAACAFSSFLPSAAPGRFASGLAISGAPPREPAGEVVWLLLGLYCAVVLSDLLILGSLRRHAQARK